MDTTQTEPEAVPANAGKRLWLAGVGALISPLTFLFGGFVALLVLPFILPPLKRWRMLAYGLFAGVVLVRVLMFAGVNPVLSYAQSEVIAKLETALGAEVSFERSSGDVVNGRLQFEKLHADIPELKGRLEIEQLTVDVGWFLFYRPDGVEITGRGLHLSLNAEDGRLEEWLAGRESETEEAVRFTFEEGLLEVSGGVGARFMLNSLNGQTSSQGWVLHLGMREAAVTFRERTHTFQIYGGMSVGDSGDGLRIETDLRAVEPELGDGVLRGSLRPGGNTFITCSVDKLHLGPLWARYRKVDEYGGLCRGRIKISGELNKLLLELDMRVENYTYYHTTAMALDRTNAFDLPLGFLTGRVVLVDGKDVVFEDVMLVTEDATLATGKRMNARGSGMIVLNGIAPVFTAHLEAVVESGEINHQITWAREQVESLEDITPNIVIVGEQFATMDMTWELELKQIAVNTSPLTGTMAGKLSGTFTKEDGGRKGKLRAEGELLMQDGKVECLGLQGDFTGKLIFNPTAPTRHAQLRGQIDAELAGLSIDCEVSGEVSHPWFIFKGMTTSPEALGRTIYLHSDNPLSEAEKLKRRNECTKVFGAYAASKQNPFEARSAGKVSFGFR